METMWYVARTEPRAEFKATQELELDGYHVFFPRIIETNARLGQAETPLFPGYLFLHFDPETEGWPSFRNVHHIAGWVKFGGVVPSLPDSDIVELKEHLELINQHGGMLRQFSRGEMVHVDSGNFQGIAEIIDGGKSSHARAKVLLRFMGRLIQAQIPWENLRAAEDHPVARQRPPRRTRGKGRWVGALRPVPSVTG